MSDGELAKLPDDIRSYLEVAIKLVRTLGDLRFVAESHRENGLVYILEAGPLPYSTITIRDVEQMMQLIFSERDEPIFPYEWIEEVAAARHKYAPKFTPNFGDTDFAVVEGRSAFELIARHVLHLAGLVDYRIEFRGIIDASSSDDESVIDLAHEDALHLAFLLGALSAAPDLTDFDRFERELKREAVAVWVLRQRRESWFDLDTLPAEADITGDVSDNVNDTKNRDGSFKQLSAFRRAILSAFKDRDAISEDTSLSSQDVATLLRVDNDARLRQELSNLRQQKWIGGRKGQRGYWLARANEVVVPAKIVVKRQ